MSGHETIIIIDFGSQYTQLITRRIREANVYSEVYPHDVDVSHIQNVNVKTPVANQKDLFWQSFTSGTITQYDFYEIVDNSIDEAMAGFCDKISVIIHTDKSVSVEDNGRGIPVGLHKSENMPALEVVLTKLTAIIEATTATAPRAIG